LCDIQLLPLNALIAILLQIFTVPLKEESNRIIKPVYGVVAVSVEHVEII
jgi:hypothetical protein